MTNLARLASLAILASLSAATPALADSMLFNSGDIGKTVTLSYDGFSGGTTVSGLTGSTTFTLTGVSGNTYSFDYSVSNTSSSPVTGSRISSFAFNTDPTISNVSSTGAFSLAQTNSSYPNGIGSVDVCFKDAKTGACSGGGKGGLTQGQTGTGTFTLSFASPVSALTLSDFYVRYQSITGVPGISSASGAGTISSSTSGGSTSGGSTSGGSTSGGSTSGGTEVPEPGMLGLFGAGIIGLALARRRRAPARVSFAMA